MQTIDTTLPPATYLKCNLFRTPQDTIRGTHLQYCRALEIGETYDRVVIRKDRTWYAESSFFGRQTFNEVIGLNPDTAGLLRGFLDADTLDVLVEDSNGNLTAIKKAGVCL